MEDNSFTNVVLVPAAQQLEMTIYIHFPLPPGPPCHLTSPSHHRALSWAPCATQQPPTSHLTHGGAYVGSDLLIHPAFPSSPAVFMLFSIASSLFLPCKQVHRDHFQEPESLNTNRSPFWKITMLHYSRSTPPTPRKLYFKPMLSKPEVVSDMVNFRQLRSKRELARTVTAISSHPLKYF